MLLESQCEKTGIRQLTVTIIIIIKHNKILMISNIYFFPFPPWWWSASNFSSKFYDKDRHMSNKNRQTDHQGKIVAILVSILPTS